MKFGVCLPTFRYGAEPTTDHIFAVARSAEEHGFDSVWVGDHVLVPADQTRMRFFADPLLTLGVVAGMTSRVQLGTSVVVAPLRNPLVLAKQSATLDYLSSGRLILGLGAGWLEREFNYLNADFNQRGSLFDETIRVLRTVWGAVPASFDGEFYQFDDAVLEPQPHQPGGPPIWIGGSSRRALQRTAELGDAWHADDTPAEEVARVREILLGYAETAGRSVDVTTRVSTRVVGVGMTSTDAPSREEGYYREADAWSGIVGTPDELLDQVQEFADAGSSHFIAQFEHASVDEHLESMRAFADAVISRFPG
jgi:probable F420-dependent oxidoreductase